MWLLTASRRSGFRPSDDDRVKICTTSPFPERFTVAKKYQLISSSARSLQLSDLTASPVGHDFSPYTSYQWLVAVGEQLCPLYGIKPVAGLMHNKHHTRTPGCWHSLTHRHQCDPILALSLSLKVGYWWGHLDTPMPSLCLTHRTEWWDKDGTKQQCVRS